MAQGHCEVSGSVMVPILRSPSCLHLIMAGLALDPLGLGETCMAELHNHELSLRKFLQ